MPPKKKMKPFEDKKHYLKWQKHCVSLRVIEVMRFTRCHAVGNNTDSQASENDTGQTGSQASASALSSTPCVEQTETQWKQKPFQKVWLTKYPWLSYETKNKKM